MKKIIILLVLALSLTGCLPDARDPITNEEGNIEEQQPIFGGSTILLGTTIPEESELLNNLVNEFSNQMNIRVNTIYVGIDEAIEMAQNAEVDVVFMNSKDDELKLIEDGHGTNRYEVMEGEIILVGPQDSIIKDLDIIEAFKIIYENELPFISGGSNSLTSRIENDIWEQINLLEKGQWYNNSEGSMMEILLEADGINAYTLVDKEIYLSVKKDVNLEVITEDDTMLRNPYGVITIDPTKSPVINELGALAFANWIIFDDAKDIISEYGSKEYKESIYVPTSSK